MWRGGSHGGPCRLRFLQGEKRKQSIRPVIYAGRGRIVLTGSLNKIFVVLPRQERVRQIPEELLQEASYAVDIVEKVLGISEVQLR